MLNRLKWPLIIVATVILVGTAGYTLIERWSVFDSLYMTIITVGTIGYGETHPLSTAGRAFTMVLILAGVGALGFSLAQFIDFLLEGHLTGYLEGRRMQKSIGGLRGHSIVAGFGRVGSVACQSLFDEGAEFVVVDSDPRACEEAREAGWICIEGDATEEEVLISAGVARAGSIITALSGDAENLFVTVTARGLNADAFIVSRSSHASTEPKLIKAGANRTITPNVIGGRRMAAMVLRPTVSEYLDIVTQGDGVEYRLQEVELSAHSCFAGKTLAEARIRELTGAQVVAILGRDGTVDGNPGPDTVVSAGEKLVVLGTVTAVETLALEACRL
jgi:voltage-gated potassium channel